MTQASAPAGRFAEGDFRVGQVLSRSLSVLSRNFLKFLIIPVLVYLPLIVIGILALALMPAIRAGAMGTAPLVVMGLLLFVAAIVLGIVSQAAMAHAAFQDMRGRRVSLVNSLNVSFRRLLPLAGIAIVIGLTLLGVIIALSALAGFLRVFVSPVLTTVVAFVGGVTLAFVVMIMWYVAIPACIVETKGVFASLARSSQLTKGHRWKIFGLLLLLVLISIVVGLPLGIVIEIAVVPLFGSGVAAVASGIINVVWNITWIAYYAIAVAVIYHDLRAAKEGVGIDEIASVFD